MDNDDASVESLEEEEDFFGVIWIFNEFSIVTWFLF